MGPCGNRWLSSAWLLALMVGIARDQARAQVFVVGEKSATANLSTEFHPTNVLLPQAKLTERGRRELIRSLEAEQGFAHRALPLGASLTLHANGELTPGADEYRHLVYSKGTTAMAGERVVISRLDIKSDRIVFDLNGGPYLPHRFLRHVQLNDSNVVTTNTDTASGSRLTLVFDKYVPEIGAADVKALIDEIVDFNAKSGEKAYADTLSPKLHDAILAHQALVGMDRRMVVAAVGQPQSKVRESNGSGGHYEEWIYGQPPQTVRFVRFIGDRVIMIKIAARGKPIEIRDKDETDGYLPAVPTREIAMGDAQPNPDRSASTPPTLRQPGEPEPPGTMKKVALPADTPNNEKPPVGQPQ